MNSPLFMTYFGSHEAEAEALVAAIIDATNGRLTPERVSSTTLGKITYTTEEDEQAAELLGKEVAKGLFATKSITIYEGGYVKVTFMLGGKNVQPERLISIEASTDLARKKSAAGRTTAFVLTAGLNMLTTNKKGDVFLTMVTDQQTHVLKDQASDTTIKTIKRLEAAGNAVLKGVEQSQSQPPPSEGKRAVSERLAELSLLLSEGQISQEEHDELRRSVLNEI